MRVMDYREGTIEVALDVTIGTLLSMGKRRLAGVWQGDNTFENYYMRVLTNSHILLNGNVTEEELAKQTKCDIEWCREHFSERISGVPTNPGKAYKIWPYNTFKPGDDPYMEGKQFSHTYQERFWPREAGPGPFMANGIRYGLGDLTDVITLLREQPLTRQAYLPIWFPEDTGATKGQRVPCTLGYYFWIEDEKVNCNYTIRSCDIFRHFRNDVYLTLQLLKYISQELNLIPGEVNIAIYNLHCFENDLYILKKKERNNGNTYI